MLRRIAFKLISVPAVAIFLGLAILGWGGVDAFFAHPPLVVLFIVTVLLTVAAFFTEGNISSGEREDRGNRWVIYTLLVVGLLAAWLPAYTDRMEIWTIGDERTRWIGVVLYAAGGVLRLWPVFVLGRRFSGLVAIQTDHQLVTDGIYGAIRHPSYLGLIVNMLGWALAFRSLAGILLALLATIVVIGRITAEEKLLARQFGAPYDAYRQRTSRLIPGIY
ncbi:MAG TPA: isoprenylcysteine carboxylmethyltransferase family protein [Terriglobales bacterium]|nr:isoprenylcysteine carboxylmethyltransferase family protein [Terriglobales bacterium]